MGIQGLLPVCKHVISPCSLEEYRNKSVAVDGYAWLHKAVYGCCVELALKETSNKSKTWIQYCLNLIDMILYYNITIYMVFDGANLPAKAETENVRAMDRLKNYEKGLAAFKASNSNYNDPGARMYFSRCIDVNPEMAAELIQLLRVSRKSVHVIVAPYEADAQLAYLSVHRIVDAIISEDSDTIPYGCREVLYKLNNNSQGMCERIILNDLLSKPITNTKTNSTGPSDGITSKPINNLNIDCSEFTQDMIVTMCIAAGCDYLASVKKFGIKKSYKYVAKYKDAIKLLRGMRLEGLLPTEVIKLDHQNPDKNMDENSDKNRILQYEWDFYKAILTYYHQTVYDPRTKQMVSLYPMEHQTSALTAGSRVTCPSTISPIIQSLMMTISPNNPNIFGFLGRIHPDHSISQGIAEGFLHPVTYEPFRLPPINTQLHPLARPHTIHARSTHQTYTSSYSKQLHTNQSMNRFQTGSHGAPVSNNGYSNNQKKTLPKKNTNTNSMMMYVETKTEKTTSTTVSTSETSTTTSSSSYASVTRSVTVPAVMSGNTGIVCEKKDGNFNATVNTFSMYGLFQGKPLDPLKGKKSAPPVIGRDANEPPNSPQIDIYEIEEDNHRVGGAAVDSKNYSNGEIDSAEGLELSLQRVTGVHNVPSTGSLIPKSTHDCLLSLSQLNSQQAADRLLCYDDQDDADSVGMGVGTSQLTDFTQTTVESTSVHGIGLGIESLNDSTAFPLASLEPIVVDAEDSTELLDVSFYSGGLSDSVMTTPSDNTSTIARGDTHANSTVRIVEQSSDITDVEQSSDMSVDPVCARTGTQASPIITCTNAILEQSAVCNMSRYRLNSNSTQKRNKIPDGSLRLTIARNTTTKTHKTSTKTMDTCIPVATTNTTTSTRNYFDAFKCKTNVTTDANGVKRSTKKRQKTILQTINGNNCNIEKLERNATSKIERGNDVGNELIIINDDSNL